MGSKQINMYVHMLLVKYMIEKKLRIEVPLVFKLVSIQVKKENK